VCWLSQTCSCSGLNADSSEKLLRSEIAGPGLATEKPWIPLLRISDATSNAALEPAAPLSCPPGRGSSKDATSELTAHSQRFCVGGYHFRYQLLLLSFRGSGALALAGLWLCERSARWVPSKACFDVAMPLSLR